MCFKSFTMYTKKIQVNPFMFNVKWIDWILKWIIHQKALTSINLNATRWQFNEMWGNPTPSDWAWLIGAYLLPLISSNLPSLYHSTDGSGIPLGGVQLRTTGPPAKATVFFGMARNSSLSTAKGRILGKWY